MRRPALQVVRNPFFEVTLLPVRLELVGERRHRHQIVRVDLVVAQIPALRVESAQHVLRPTRLLTGPRDIRFAPWFQRALRPRIEALLTQELACHEERAWLQRMDAIRPHERELRILLLLLGVERRHRSVEVDDLVARRRGEALHDLRATRQQLTVAARLARLVHHRRLVVDGRRAPHKPHLGIVRLEPCGQLLQISLIAIENLLLAGILLFTECLGPQRAADVIHAEHRHDDVWLVRVHVLGETPQTPAHRITTHARIVERDVLFRQPFQIVARHKARPSCLMRDGVAEEDDLRFLLERRAKGSLHSRGGKSHHHPLPGNQNAFHFHSF